MKIFTTFASISHNRILYSVENTKILSNCSGKILSFGNKTSNMKKFLPIYLLFALICCGNTLYAADPEIIEGVEVVSVSDSGNWILGQADGEGILYIKDLASGTVYTTGGGASATGRGYTAGVGKSISDEGTVIALNEGIPYWWRVDTEKWTRLPGETQDGSAMVGSITPDGSVIVGGLGNTGTTLEEVQMILPCIWRRTADGSYGEPEFLPNPDKDPYGYVPQYVNCVAVSPDARVVAAIMTVESGMLELPYIYTQDDQGNWTYKQVGMQIVDPSNPDFRQPATGRPADGYNFMFNNACVSPDGKYAFYTIKKTYVIDPTDPEDGIVNIYSPIRFDVSTGNYLEYETEESMVLTSVAADYSVLCRIQGADDHDPGSGWIFPQGNTEGMSIPEFIKAKSPAATYDWMERNMYRECIVGVGANDKYILDDKWTVGMPFCNANLSLIACSNSTFYWADSYYNQYSFVSFLLYTGINVEDNGVETIGADRAITVLPGGELKIVGEAVSIGAYDLSGILRLSLSHASGVVDTRLPKGVYLLRAVWEDGTAQSLKIVI